MLTDHGRKIVGGAICAFVVIWSCWNYDFARVGAIGALTFVANAAVIATLFVRIISRGPVNLLSIHLIAVWIMLVVAPMSAYVTEGFQFYDFFSLEISEEKFAATNGLVLLWTVLVVLSYDYCIKHLNPSPTEPAISFTDFDILAQVVIALGTLGWLLVEVGAGIMTRQGFESVRDFEGASDFVMFQSGLRGFSFVTLAAVLANAIRKTGWASRRAWLLVFLGLLAAVLTVNNPFAAARFITGVLVVAISFLVWFRNRRSSLGFFSFTILSVFFVFPVLDLSRRSEDIAGMFEDSSSSIAEALTGDTFRTYESIPAAIEYVAHQGSTMGSQLIGNLLFFITRDIWPLKPVGSGTMLATFFGSMFTNVACSLPCEALVNFGYAGFPIAALTMGFVFAKLDLRYRSAEVHFRRGVLTPYFVIYPFLLGFIFFLTRGDFLTPFSSFALYCAALTPMILLAVIRYIAGRSRNVPRSAPSGLGTNVER